MPLRRSAPARWRRPSASITCIPPMHQRPRLDVAVRRIVIDIQDQRAIRAARIISIDAPRSAESEARLPDSGQRALHQSRASGPPSTGSTGHGRAGCVERRQNRGRADNDRNAGGRRIGRAGDPSPRNRRYPAAADRAHHVRPLRRGPAAVPRRRYRPRERRSAAIRPASGAPHNARSLHHRSAERRARGPGLGHDAVAGDVAPAGDWLKGWEWSG